MLLLNSIELFLLISFNFFIKKRKKYFIIINYYGFNGFPKYNFFIKNLRNQKELRI